MNLNDREKNILRYIIQQFILTASPVGSRNITKKYDLGISPATVRNIMSDLEDSGFIGHPHTSAGRIPTDKGYRFYVDSLMDIPVLTLSDKNAIKQKLNVDTEPEDLFNIASTLLSSITNQLACVTYPKIDSSILEKIQIIQLSSIKILVVITVKAGIIKTITLEMNSELDSTKIQDIEQVLNEKLCGLSFNEIKTTFKDRFTNLPGEQQPIIRFFLDSVDKIFKDFPQNEKIFISGAKNVIKQPEFETPEKFQSVIELIEDKNIIVHILEKSNESKSDNVSVSIGSEIDFDKLSEYSLISKEYKMGDVSGSLGIIGPKRMEYEKVVAIVDYVAKMLTEVLKNEILK